MSHSLLLVDDEQPLLRAMREFFELRGFAVDCATELEEALALLEYRSYSLVICDICLQGLRDTEGLEIVALLRSTRPETRVIVLSGIPRAELRDRGTEHEVDRFLLKPHPLPQLASLVETILENGNGAHEHSS